MAIAPTKIDPEQQAEDELAAGFEETAPTVQATAEPPKPAEPAPAKIEPAPAAAPQYVQITKEQFAALQAAADEVPRLKQHIEKSFGTFGNTIKRLEQAATSPIAGALAIDPDAFAELQQDFPELAENTKKGLERVFAKLKPGSGTAPDLEAIQKRVDAQVMRHETEALEDAHPDWQTVIGVPNAKGEIPQTEFRQWLGKQPAAYANRVNSTYSATIIGRAIDRFLADKTKPATPAPQRTAQVDLRRQRIAGAVTPRGDGGPVKAPKTANDELEAGFNEG